MSTRATDAVQVQAQASDVESLHDRGVTWVSFKPIPDLACGIDFTSASFLILAFCPGRCGVSDTSMRAATVATATMISAFT
jgi:hypothetical protein